MKTKITVTKSHISRAANLVRNGKSISTFCPISLAVRPLLKRKYQKDFGTGISCLCIGDEYFKMPDEARDFVEIFDNSYRHDIRNIEPISFEAEIPKKYLKSSK